MAQIDLEEEVLQDLSDQFNKHFDVTFTRSIEMEHLIKQGWHRVDIDRVRSAEYAIEIAQWTEENCGKYLNLWTTFIFKDSRDAVLFKLKWG